MTDKELSDVRRLNRKLAAALRPFTFRTKKMDGTLVPDPWTDDPTKMTQALICDNDVLSARSVLDEFEAMADAPDSKGRAVSEVDGYLFVSAVLAMVVVYIVYSCLVTLS